MEFVSKYNSHILSVIYTLDSNSTLGKMKWLRKNLRLTQKSRIHLVLNPKNRILIMTNNKV